MYISKEIFSVDIQFCLVKKLGNVSAKSPTSSTIAGNSDSHVWHMLHRRNKTVTILYPNIGQEETEEEEEKKVNGENDVTFILLVWTKCSLGR